MDIVLKSMQDLCHLRTHVVDSEGCFTISLQTRYEVIYLRRILKRREKLIINKIISHFYKHGGDFEYEDFLTNLSEEYSIGIFKEVNDYQYFISFNPLKSRE